MFLLLCLHFHLEPLDLFAPPPWAEGRAQAGQCPIYTPLGQGWVGPGWGVGRALPCLRLAFGHGGRAFQFFQKFFTSSCMNFRWLGLSLKSCMQIVILLNNKVKFSKFLMVSFLVIAFTFFIKWYSYLNKLLEIKKTNLKEKISIWLRT